MRSFRTSNKGLYKGPLFEGLNPNRLGDNQKRRKVNTMTIKMYHGETGNLFVPNHVVLMTWEHAYAYDWASFVKAWPKFKAQGYRIACVKNWRY